MQVSNVNPSGSAQKFGKTARIRAAKAEGLPLPPLEDKYIPQKHESKEMAAHRSATYDTLFKSPPPSRQIPEDKLFAFEQDLVKKDQENLRLIEAGQRKY